MKILIIEDEILIAKTICKLVEMKGHSATTTASGSAAIKLIKETQFDRIVCDLMLQDISGFDVIEESKQIYSANEIKIKFIIMTAYNSPQVIEKAETYGCKILQKPFNNIQFALESILEFKNE